MAGRSRTRSARRARVRRMTARLLALWGDATADELAAGLDWYHRARARCRVIARTAGITLRQAAGVVAALSPRCHWSVNLAWAGRVCLARTTGAECPVVSLGHCRRKAWAIAGGADPSEVLRGPKVRAFYRSIMGDVGSVTVDRWAEQAATGRTTGRGVVGNRYLEIESAFRAAAGIVGVSPRELQAALWVHVRGSAD